MATKTNTNKNTNAKTAKKAPKKADKPTCMTYPQTLALTNALFHAGYTAKEMSEKIDSLLSQLDTKNKNPMKPEAKEKWLAEHGDENATYGQCKMYAFTLFGAKWGHDKASELIDQLDKKSGYVRKPKEGAKAEPKPVPTPAKQESQQVSA